MSSIGEEFILSSAPHLSGIVHTVRRDTSLAEHERTCPQRGWERKCVRHHWQLSQQLRLQLHIACLLDAVDVVESSNEGELLRDRRQSPLHLVLIIGAS